MKKLVLLVAVFSISSISFSQVNKGERPESGYYGQTSIVTGSDEIGDFTITDSDGNILNLYENLEAGKTVILDLFFST